MWVPVSFELASKIAEYCILMISFRKFKFRKLIVYQMLLNFSLSVHYFLYFWKKNETHSHSLQFNFPTEIHTYMYNQLTIKTPCVLLTPK